MFDEIYLNFRIRGYAEACKSFRSRQEFSNEYLLAKIGFDTAENEPFNFHNFSCLQGFKFHRAVVSQRTDAKDAMSTPTSCRARSRLHRRQLGLRVYYVESRSSAKGWRT